MVIDYQN